MALLGFLDDARRHPAVARDDHAVDSLLQAVNQSLVPAVTDEDDVVLLDDILNHADAACGDAHIAANLAALIAVDDNLTVNDADHIAEGDARVGEILHAEFLEIALREVADGHDADEPLVFIDDGNRLQIVFTHDFAEMTQAVRFFDDSLAVERDVLHARIEIGDEKRLFHVEVVQSKFRLLIDLSRARRHNILAHRLLQMRIADCGADGIRIRIAMPYRIDRFRIFHRKEASRFQMIYDDFHYILRYTRKASPHRQDRNHILPMQAACTIFFSSPSSRSERCSASSSKRPTAHAPKPSA